MHRLVPPGFRPARDARSRSAAGELDRLPSVALALAVGAAIAAAWRAPGQYLALAGGIAAVGTGWVAYGRREAPGVARLAAAGAITVGGIGLLLGALRVAIALAALGHLGRVLG